MSDLSLIFDKSYIVNHYEDIDENTVCYINDIGISTDLPTYNLRYIYGDVYINYRRVKNLDNLQKVYGDMFVYNCICNTEDFVLNEFYNLDKQKVIFLEENKCGTYISNIKYVECGELFQLTEKDYNYVLNKIKTKKITTKLFLNIPKTFYTKELIFCFLNSFDIMVEPIDYDEKEKAYNIVPRELLDNEIIIPLLQANGENLKYIPRELINKDLILDFIKSAPYDQIKLAFEYIPYEYYNDILLIDRVLDRTITRYSKKSLKIDNSNSRIYRNIRKKIPINILLYKLIVKLSKYDYELPKNIFDLFINEKVITADELEKFENLDREIIKKELYEEPAINEIISLIPKKYVNNKLKVKE